MAANSFFVLYLLCWVTYVCSQCLSPNDGEADQSAVNEAINTLVDGSISFSIQMLREINNDQISNTNTSGIFFSPFSVWSALMVTYMGANGVTEREMRLVLGLGNTDKVTAWSAYRNMRPTSTDGDPSFRLANRIYFQEGTSFRDCMREVIESEIAFLNFESEPEGSRENINEWVEEQTERRIKDLVPAGGISALTRMVVANAVYFKESWMEEFDPFKTRKGYFTLSSRRKMFAQMMSMKGQLLYATSEELQCRAVELPYAKNDLSMVILLPKNKYIGLGVLLRLLTAERLTDLLDDMTSREVHLSLPKFNMEDSFELASVLGRMGLRSLFDPRRVDLSGFTGSRDFAMDAVHHKSFIDVNEQGTEAAGATGGILTRNGRLGPVGFRADHPFLFLIRDNLSNVILFMGTVQRPPDAPK